MENRPNKEKDRTQEEYLNLTRSEAQNHYRTEASKAEKKEVREPSAMNRFTTFIQSSFFSWIYHYFKSRFGPNHKFQTYDLTKEDNGIYKLEKNNQENNSEVIVALVSDWATDTAEADEIGDLIKSRKPDYTIHLGDTYFVGMIDEIKDNFISGNCSWHRGSSGSFSLLGNHEMYSRGISYFRDLLPTLGIYSKERKKFLGQKTSYFCLENDYWRIIGLDTGYNSVGFPIIEFIFKPKCELEDAIVKWMNETLNLKNDKRGIVLLSHHQYCSAFEEDFRKPAEQICDILGRDRPVLWFWGHEHRLAVYGKYKSENGISAFGRCIGHGGMPIEFKEKIQPKKAQELILYDERNNTEIKNIKVGYNGFVILKIYGGELSAEYFDINDNLLIKETWISDIQKGEIRGKEIELVSKDLTVYFSDLNKAIN